MNWDTAREVCDEHGARLCTSAELLAGCAAGGGCSLDTELSWSSSACSLSLCPQEESGAPQITVTQSIADETADFTTDGWSGSAQTAYSLERYSEYLAPAVYTAFNPAATAAAPAATTADDSVHPTAAHPVPTTAVVSSWALLCGAHDETVLASGVPWNSSTPATSADIIASGSLGTIRYESASNVHHSLTAQLIRWAGVWAGGLGRPPQQQTTEHHHVSLGSATDCANSAYESDSCSTYLTYVSATGRCTCVPKATDCDLDLTHLRPGASSDSNNNTHGTLLVLASGQEIPRLHIRVSSHFTQLLPWYGWIILAGLLWQLAAMLSCYYTQHQNGGYMCLGNFLGRGQIFGITGGYNDNRLESTETRIVLRGNADPCGCWPGRSGGFRLQATELPAPLRELGVSQEIWAEHMRKLKQVDRKQCICAPIRPCMSSYVPLFWLLPNATAGYCKCCCCCCAGESCTICVLPIFCKSSRAPLSRLSFA
eukprot:COSAG05_NODE_331_length_11273_cov_3.896635_11_plen_484_part_00